MNSPFNELNEFLYNSICDIQSTIRAIDLKISFLLVILLVFVSKINAIFSVIKFFYNLDNITASIFFISISALFLSSWFLALLLSLRVLIAIGNPREKITGDTPQSFFFPANLYSIKWRYIFFCCESKSNKSLNEYFNIFPQKTEEITKQLALEQMKLIYIANYKLKQSQLAFYITLTWLFWGGLLYIFYQILN